MPLSFEEVLNLLSSLSLLLLGNEKAARCMLLNINYARERSRISCVLLPNQSEISENHRKLSGLSRALKVCFNIWGEKQRDSNLYLKAVMGHLGLP